MPRKKKSVLNQNTKKTKVKEPKEVEEVIEIPKENSLAGLENDDSPQYHIPEVFNDEKTEQEEISLKVSGEKLSEVIKEKEIGDLEESEEDIDEEIVEKARPIHVREVDKDVIKKMSKRELRWFQRTGKLPN